MGDDAQVEWTVGPDNLEVAVESSEVKELAPNEEHDCPEILYGGSVPVKGFFAAGGDDEQVDDDE